MNTTGQNVVSVATASITAVVAVVGAYFGIKSANSAQEDTAQRLDAAHSRSMAALTEALTDAHDDAQSAAKRNEIMISTITGALSNDQAKDALQTADQRIKAAPLTMSCVAGQGLAVVGDHVLERRDDVDPMAGRPKVDVSPVQVLGDALVPAHA